MNADKAPPSTAASDPRRRVRPLLRTRQVREFTDEPIQDDVIDAMLEVARWSGSSRNEQPWRFVLIRDAATIARLAAAGMPQTRLLHTAPAAIAIVLPDEPDRAVSRAFDDGRVAERLLIAAGMLDIAAGIAWIRGDVRPAIREALGLPDGWLVRTIVGLGHPTAAARTPKSAPGEARRPLEELVHRERWSG